MQVPIRAWKLKEEDKLQGNVFGMLIVERFKGFRMQKFPYLNGTVRYKCKKMTSYLKNTDLSF